MWLALFAVIGLLLGAVSPAYADELDRAAQNTKFSTLLFGLFIGILLTASAYLFFIWIVMRDRGQVFLICLLLSLCLYIVSTNDLLMTAVGLQEVNVRTLVADYSLILSIIFSTAFTYYFLELDVFSPAFGYPLGALSAVLGLFLIVLLFDRSQVQLILPLLSTVTIGVILVAGVAGVRQGISGSLIHIIAFTFFLSGALADSLYEIGLIGSASTSHNLTYLAFAMSALMFAIVIASQFAARQDEKEKALAVSNERFVLATRGANEGLFDWNLVSGEVFFSSQFGKILNRRFENTAQGMKQWTRMVVDPDRRIFREPVFMIPNHDLLAVGEKQNKARPGVRGIEKEQKRERQSAQHDHSVRYT